MNGENQMNNGTGNNASHFAETIEALSKGYKKSTVFSSVTSHSMDIIQANVDNIGNAMRNILAALEEIQAASGSTAVNSSKINDRVQKLVENNLNMVNDVDTRIVEIETVRNDAGTIESLFRDLSTKSANIQNLTEAIQGVSEYIHLLSINTSIEAAHLGEKAAGFSVIAQEIKKLAAKTNSFSVEISDTIKQFRDAINQINEKLEGFIRLIINVEKDMANFGDRFKDYDKSLNEAGNQVQEITHAVNEESLALRDGLGSLNEISQLLADTQGITSTLNSVHAYLENLFDRHQ